MRTFHIFKIKKDYATLTKNNPYHLFKMLNFIHNLDHENIDIGANLFYKIIEKIDTTKLDEKLYQEYKNNMNYTKFKQRHNYNNYYLKEETKLILHNYFLVLTSSLNQPTFFKSLTPTDNLFICDFKNADYFWLQSITNELVKNINI
ncbi:MAG: sporulation inhibitor of replication protein SirA [Bacilli bacterium]|nr:sporulation inhibitor of replication protein SirA [Bacilli bacterium]